MNALPHIGSTISQRSMLRHYKLQQRELEAERIAAERADALLDSIREPEPCNFCAAYDTWEPMPTWLIWTVRVACSAALTIIAYALAKLLPLLWGLS